MPILACGGGGYRRLCDRVTDCEIAASGVIGQRFGIEQNNFGLDSLLAHRLRAVDPVEFDR